MQEAIATPPEPYVDGEQELTEDLQVRIVDVSQGVVANAVDNADAYIAEQTTQGGIKGFVKKIWHGNIARDYIRQRELQEGKSGILETGNIFALDGDSIVEHNQAMHAVVTRFSEGYLHSGEREDALALSEQGQETEREIKDVVALFANGTLDRDELVEEKNRILNKFGASVNAEDRNKGLMFADNIIAVAESARAAFEHGVGLDRIDRFVQAHSGEARIGARTEAKFTATDKIVDKLYSNKVGSVVNETTIALAVATVMTAAKFTTRKVTTAAGAVVGLGVGAGLIAGVREHFHITQERQQHMRERAVGAVMPEQNAKRREKLESTVYEIVPATQLIDDLARARQSILDAEPDSIVQMVDRISAIEARMTISDDESIDMIGFTNKTSVEKERLQLDVALAEAKVLAIHALEAMSPEDRNASALGVDIHQAIQVRVDGFRELITGHVDAKDAIFNKVRRNQSLKMAGIGLVSSVALGGVIQEVHAAISDDLQGVFEGDSNEQDRRSLLAGIFRGEHTQAHEESLKAAGQLHDTVLNKNATLQLPDGFTLSEQTNEGHWSVLNADGDTVVKDLASNGHGHLTEASNQALHEAGIHINETVDPYTTTRTETHVVHRSTQEYIHHNPDKFTRIHRELWMDNDTPSKFDQNELRLWWGGQTGTGMDEHGNYVMNIKQMLPDGSFHDGLSDDAQHLIHEGKMSIALSVDQGSQSHVVMVPIDKHGNAVIHANSWIAKSMFDSKDGQAHFKGAYAEAVESLGRHNGVESTHVLATVVGENNPDKIEDKVTRTIVDHHERVTSTFDFPPSAYPPENIPIEIPPVLPVYARKGLEQMGTRQENAPLPFSYLGNPNPYVPEGYKGNDRLLPPGGLAPFAPELDANPDAKIDANETAVRYKKSHTPRYKKSLATLGQMLKREPQATQPKVVVMIPAAAHQEGKNIYNTLKQYALQEGVSKQEFEVVVFANHPKGTSSKQTVDEVRRFQKENPGFAVRLIEKQLEPEEQKIGWIRKALTDSVINDLAERGVDLNEVVLVSNDADSEWINPQYIKTIKEKAEESPDTDAFLGFIDWGYDAYKAHPEMLTATRFMQMIEIYLRVSRHEIGSSGANFAFRPGIYTAVGGYRSSDGIAEDVQLGRMIKSVRAGADTRRPIAFLGRSSEVNTSARRAIDKLMKDGGAPAAQWDGDFGVNDALRDADFDLPEFDYSNPDAVERMVKATERMINQTLRIYGESLKSDNSTPAYRSGRLTMYDNETIRQINRICFFIGIEPKWHPDGRLSVINAEKMVSGLKKWQSAH
ncbi:MAG: hypothetical protein QFB86_03870 [Patescibacteria group bacterium]|nr:hypothetical protein [Patescibacteria group bacterium]